MAGLDEFWDGKLNHTFFHSFDNKRHLVCECSGFSGEKSPDFTAEHQQMSIYVRKGSSFTQHRKKPF